MIVADGAAAVEGKIPAIRLDASAGERSTPDSRTLYIANGHGNAVSVIDTATLKVVATIATAKRPWGLALTPDGRKLYSANGVSGDVSVIDTAGRREIKRIPTGAGAWGVAVPR